MTIIFLVVFFALIIFINVKNIGVENFNQYASARGSFGVLGVSMGLFAAWFTGATFVVFSDFTIGYGFIGMYTIPYALLMLITMYLISEKVFLWGKKYNIQTQAEFIGLRYQSSFLRVIIGVSSVLLAVPWLLMEWIAQGYVVSYATDGAISPVWGMVMGAGVVILYVTTGGMRSVITASIFQGGLMLFLGIGVSFYIIFHFYGSFGDAMNVVKDSYPEALTFPGPGWNPPNAYWTSAILTSGLGGFMWPWAFNRIFISGSLRSVKQAILLVPAMAIVFWLSIALLGIVLHSIDFARLNTTEAYLWAANEAGPLPLALLSTLIMATSVATAAGMIQTASTIVSNDIAKAINRKISDRLSIIIARIVVIAMGVLAFYGATVDIGRLVFVALTIYQGIIILFPIIFLGVFWKRANKEGAIIAFIVGTTIAMYCEIAQPWFIVEYGWQGGIYGLIVSFTIMIIAGYLKPVNNHVNILWNDIKKAKSETKKSAVSEKIG